MNCTLHRLLRHPGFDVVNNLLESGLVRAKNVKIGVAAATVLRGLSRVSQGLRLGENEAIGGHPQRQLLLTTTPLLRLERGEPRRAAQLKGCLALLASPRLGSARVVAVGNEVRGLAYTKQVKLGSSASWAAQARLKSSSSLTASVALGYLTASSLRVLIA